MSEIELKDNNLQERMNTRNGILYNVMKSSNWFDLKEIERLTGYPSATASAGIRDFRKKEFGSNTVNKKYMGAGIYKYQLIKNNSNKILEELYEKL